MPAEPQVNLLPYRRRKILFWFLTIFFVTAMPIVLLYTSGYRLVQTENGERVLTTTGGMYVAVFTENIDLYVDDKLPNDRRPFSSAFYVQGYDPGMYEVRTQGEGLETWVKEMPIYPQIVTQVFAFNIPRVPVIRLITEETTDDGTMIIDAHSGTSTSPLAFASSTNDVVVLQRGNAQPRLQNPEFTGLTELFASTTEERAILDMIEEQKRAVKEQFVFSSESRPVARKDIPTTTATTTAASGDMRLVKVGNDVYARWVGSPDQIPHYFCLTYTSRATTTEEYGAHIYEGLVAKYASTTGELDETFLGQKLCRDEIRIDRKWQWVQWFDFVPGSSDLVLMQLQDGIYVVEIDDRSWQNVQLLYPGDYLTMIVDAGRILVKDDEYFVEVFTEIPQ